MFGFFWFISSVYLGCVNSWFAKDLKYLTLGKDQVLHPFFARVETPKSFFSHATVCVAFWEQKLEGGNSPLLGVITTSELCETHWCSVELVGGRLIPCSGSVLSFCHQESFTWSISFKRILWPSHRVFL